MDHLKSVSQMSLIISHERVLLRVKNNYKHSHTVILLENGPKFKQIDGPVISNEFWLAVSVYCLSNCSEDDPNNIIRHFHYSLGVVVVIHNAF